MLSSLPSRLARRLGFTHNPLCRRTDREEGLLVLATLIVVLLVLGLSTVFGVASYDDAVDRPTREQAGSRLTSVTLLADAPAASSSRAPLGPGVRATWTLPDGTTRTGRVYPASKARAGAVVDVWMDSTGWPLPVERSQADYVVTGLVNGGLVLLVLGLVAGAGVLTARDRLDRIRLDSWDAEWATVEPEWRNRR